MWQSILKSSPSNPNRTSAAKTCIEHLQNSEYRLNATAVALPRKQIKDCRAWTSAALTSQYDCWSALSYVNDTKIVIDTMLFINNLVGYTSNALSMMMVYNMYGDKTGSWGPVKTERDGFWEGGGDRGKGKELGVPVGLKGNVTVYKGGACKYATVQEALNAAPDWGRGRRFVILVKAGVYKGVQMLGNLGCLLITRLHLKYERYYVAGILGDGFMASNLTIENTAGPDAHQAVAL
ncbi:putative pectinesterase [Helianthus anomalus]